MFDAKNSIFQTALYCRVSTEEQREGQTIDSQVNELERFARDKGWPVAKTYKDEGWSGAVLARPELDRLRDDATKQLFDVVLINDVDRLARDVAHLGILKRDLERHGVRVVFRKLPGENSPTHNLLVNILGSFAEFERELIADRTRRGKRYKVEVRKQYLGAIPPYGFRAISRERSSSGQTELEIASEEASVVRQMYRWVDKESLSARMVVARLNRLNIPPRKGKAWQKSSVLRILRSQVYAGTWHYNKHRHCDPVKTRSARKYRRSLQSSSRLRPKTDWLPVDLPDRLRIVELGQWNRVQRQLDRNIAFSPRNSKHSYLLSGLVRCGGCGASYVGDPSHGRFSYRCLKRCHKVPSIREEFLNETIWAAFEEALQNPDIIAMGAKFEDQKNAVGDEESHISDGLERLRVEEARVLEAYRLEILTSVQLAGELEALKRRRERLQSSRIETQKPQPVREIPRGTIKQACHFVAQKLHGLNPSQRRDLLRSLLTRAVFHGNTVRLVGSLPLPNHELPNDSDPGRIVTTTPSDRARNLEPVRKELCSPGEIIFELIRNVEV